MLTLSAEQTQTALESRSIFPKVKQDRLRDSFSWRTSLSARVSIPPGKVDLRTWETFFLMVLYCQAGKAHVFSLRSKKLICQPFDTKITTFLLRFIFLSLSLMCPATTTPPPGSAARVLATASRRRSSHFKCHRTTTRRRWCKASATQARSQ